MRKYETKKKEQEIRTLEDLTGKKIPEGSCFISETSYILKNVYGEIFDNTTEKNSFIKAI